MEAEAFCPVCGSEDTTAHVQEVTRDPVMSVHSVGWECLKCHHIWGHEGFSTEVLGY